MNWIFTRPDTPVRFEKGEPYCYIFPVSCGALEGLESNLKCSQPTRGSSASTMRGRRSARFNIDLKQPGSDAQSDKWQKLYYRGLAPDGAPKPRAA